MKDQINFVHVRRQETTGYPLFRIYTATTGGFTVAYKFDDDNRLIIYNNARCSYKDNFCKKTGRTLSAGRLSSIPERAGFLTSSISYDQFSEGKPTYKGIANYFNSLFAGRM